MQAFIQGPEIERADSEYIAFEAQLKETMGEQQFLEADCWNRLLKWEQETAAGDCHPREDHLLSLRVCYGAAPRPAQRVESFAVLVKQVSSFI